MNGQEKIPQSLTHQLYSAAQVRNGEQLAAQIAGISMFELMERAGAAVFTQLASHFATSLIKQNLLILCGQGNNGGDGYIVAKLALQQGFAVQLAHIGDFNKLTGDAKTAKDQWLAVGGKIISFEQIDFSAVEVIVDALFGIGLNRELDEKFLAIIKQINALQQPVCAVDLPSGLNADTGSELGAAIKAEITVTFIGKKQGLICRCFR